MTRASTNSTTRSRRQIFSLAFRPKAASARKGIIQMTFRNMEMLRIISHSHAAHADTPALVLFHSSPLRGAAKRNNRERTPATFPALLLLFYIFRSPSRVCGQTSFLLAFSPKTAMSEKHIVFTWPQKLLAEGHTPALVWSCLLPLNKESICNQQHGNP